MNFELRQYFTIESARFLPHLPDNHPCKRVHGHSFKIILVLIGPKLPQIEWVQDYHEIENLVKPVLTKLDHHLLNEVAGLENPTTENICQWLYEKLSVILPLLKQVRISETENTECAYPV
jgi:6-pyruvoyltetrahydropterin/6-carboxytetrahydropterin synthase